MTQLITWVVLLLVVAAGAASAHETPKADTAIANQTLPTSKAHAEVVAVVEQLHAAISKGNAALIERILAVNVQIFEQGHRESSRAEYLAHHFKADVAFASTVPSTTTAREVRMAGSLAVVLAESTSEGVFKDKPVKNANLSTYVLQRENSEWRITHIHWSSRKRP